MGKQDRLWLLCKKFVEDNDITCPEAVYQVDWVAENALEFIEKICQLVGFTKEE